METKRIDLFSMRTQGFYPIFQSLFLPVSQNSEDAFSINIGKHENELLVALFDRKLINSQHPDAMGKNRCNRCPFFIAA